MRRESAAISPVTEVIAAVRAGEIVILVDDEDRENEGDLVCAAELVTPEIISFMAIHGRGLICLPLTEERCDELQLPQPTVSHHLGLLRMNNVIGNRRSGKQVFYTLNGRVNVDPQGALNVGMENFAVKISSSD